MFLQDIWNTKIVLIFISKRNFKNFLIFHVIHQDIVILANLNIDDSDIRSDASSPNDSMEESQCMEKTR